tara:strand:- start:3740 stop:3868 length:129 start_codon:yes stop_codon:yes gene_type:complete
MKFYLEWIFYWGLFLLAIGTWSWMLLAIVVAVFNGSHTVDFD